LPRQLLLGFGSSKHEDNSFQTNMLHVNIAIFRDATREEKRIEFWREIVKRKNHLLWLLQNVDRKEVLNAVQ